MRRAQDKRALRVHRCSLTTGFVFLESQNVRVLLIPGMVLVPHAVQRAADPSATGSDDNETATFIRRCTLDLAPCNSPGNPRRTSSSVLSNLRRASGNILSTCLHVYYSHSLHSSKPFQLCFHP